MSYTSKNFHDKIVQLLKAGSVGFMPSDTIYGLSCQALNEEAVERVYRLKKRDSDKPLILLIANISQLEQLGIDESEVNQIEKYWPGALTIICKTTKAPEYLHRGTNSLAIRMPNNAELLKLIEEVGPIVSSSANLQGDEPINSIEVAKKSFGEELDFYVDGGDLSDKTSSTLVRSVEGKLEVIRPGAIKL